MALTNPQGTLILLNNSSQRVSFSVTGTTLSTSGTNLEGVVTANMQAWYRFENNLNDSDPNSLGIANGTAQGSITFAAGQEGNAAFFDGSSSVDLSNPSKIRSTANFTWDMWLKFSTSTGIKVISNFGATSSTGFQAGVMFNYQYWSSHFAISGRFGGIDTILSYTSPSETVTNWNHYVISYNGTHLKLFVNKILRAITTVSGNITYADTDNRFGNRPDLNAITFYDGYMDSFKIYNVALSDGGITTTGQTATGDIATNYSAEGGV